MKQRFATKKRLKRRIPIRVEGKASPDLILPLRGSTLSSALKRLSRGIKFRVWSQRAEGMRYAGEMEDGIWKRGYHSAPAVKIDDKTAYLSWLVIDIDDEHLPIITEPISNLPFFIAFSGRGWHIHIPVFDYVSIDEIELAKAWIRKYTKGMGVDYGALSPFHPIRNIGTINAKTGIPKQVVYVHEMARLDWREFIDMVSREITISEPKISQNGNSVSKTIFKILKEGMEEGGAVGNIHGRNYAAYILSIALPKAGIDRETAAAMIEYWNFELNSPPLDERELREAARNVFDAVEYVKPISREDYENILSQITPKSVGQSDKKLFNTDSEETSENADSGRSAEGCGYEEEGRSDSNRESCGDDQCEGEGYEVVREVSGCCNTSGVQSQREDGRVVRGSCHSVCVCGGGESTRRKSTTSSPLSDPDGCDEGNKGRDDSVQTETDANEIDSSGGIRRMAHSVDNVFISGSTLIVRSEGEVKEYPALSAIISPRVYRNADYVAKLRGGYAKFLNLFSGRTPRTDDDEYAIYNPITTYLIAASLKHKRQFRVRSDKKISELKILSFDLEVKSEAGRFPKASNEDDRIFIISLATFRPDGSIYSKVIHSDDEAELIRNFFNILEQYDPDVLVGHNIFGFDLPYIVDRAVMHGIEPFNGRRYSVSKAKKRLAERSTYVDIWRIEGMDVIDTFILAQMWDVFARKLEGYGLKDIARQLGFAAEERAMVDRENIYEAYKRDRDLTLMYAKQDAEEALGVFNALAPPYFELCKVVPVDFIGAIMGGSGQMFDLMLVAEYVENGIGLPKRLPFRRQEWGGYTDIFVRGVVQDAHHVDVASLYPSIMLRFKVEPENDELGVFQRILKYLTETRLELKRKAKEAKDIQSKSLYEAQSSAMKLLINSAYGMMGFAGAYFRCTDSADFVARTGQDIIKSIIKYVEDAGGMPILCDTDGLIFQSGVWYTGDEMVEYIQRRLDEDWGGIKIDYEGHYIAVLVHGKKNYATLRDDGKLTMKGGAFRSRMWEKFKLDLVQNVAKALLDNKPDLAKEILEKTAERLLNGEMTAEEVAITTSVNTDELKNLPHLYAAYRDERDYHIGDKVTYYIREMPDVKLYKLRAFEAAFPISSFANDYHREYYYKKRFLPIARTLNELIEIVSESGYVKL